MQSSASAHFAATFRAQEIPQTQRVTSFQQNVLDAVEPWLRYAFRSPRLSVTLCKLITSMGAVLLVTIPSAKQVALGPAIYR